MEYNFRDIEKKWQQQWRDNGAYKVSNDSSKPKYYVLDMFPYPSGAGLHVGHPLGYIASDIYARFKRLKGYNVLHPMGFDSFGLPAEQYAIETGQHPAVTTEKNIARYREQLDNIGFCYDWSREVRTSDPKYYKWTQYIFLQLFNSWYNRKANKTERIETLINTFETEGNKAVVINPKSPVFSGDEWKAFGEARQQEILMEYRIAYSAFGEVNWCEALGTVLANDEVINGVSERGGHPVVKKKMRQWYLRITEYADRLLQGLEQVDFSDAMKEMQRNWIGKSQGAEITFKVKAPSRPSPAGKESQHTEPAHYTADPSLYNITKTLAEEKRQNPTDEEELLWQRLKGNKVGFHIRRQHIIGSYIVDFVCIDKKVTIEVDGGYHNNEEQKKYDEARTAYLNEKGFTEIRFSNEEVRNNIETVLKKIAQTLSTQPSSKGVEGDVSGQVSPEGGDLEGASLVVYTTRPDTIFGVDFMVVAPEHEMVKKITSSKQHSSVEDYLHYVQSRSERERLAEVKSITGAFTGAYAINPFDGREIPIWISEYVLAGYGTGAIMAVPCGDQRDFSFAKHFNIPITNIIGDAYNGEEANPTKDAILQNSDFLNGMVMRDAMNVVIDKLEELGIGKRQINYRMRDAGFSRQRYWGEPFPIVYKGGVAYPMPEHELPLELPYVDSYSPGPEGEGPLANITEWVSGEPGQGHRETNTMPGYAGSSWYFLRYMDPNNENSLVDKKVADYWGQVDLYIGGTEHAVGHLLYSRMWTKALYDLGYIGFDEPYKRLVNQGMIVGKSYFCDYAYYVDKETKQRCVLYMRQHLSTKLGSQAILNEREYYFENGWLANGDARLKNVHPFVDSQGRLTESEFEIYKSKNPWSDNERIVWEEIYENGEHKYLYTEHGEKYIQLQEETEKMSKSKFNVVNPDDVVERFGADTFRMYEMFLGPVEQSKPWDTKGIEGVHRFLRKFWRLFADENKGLIVTNDAPTPAELKVLHRTIKKIEDDTERFSFNTAVSTFMIAVNELGELKCHKKDILEPLVILLTPYAPHIAEELYQLLKVFPGGGDLEGAASVLDAPFPVFEQKHLIESSKEYPVSINGKLRTNMTIALDVAQPEVERLVLGNEVVQKWLEGKQPKKIIYVKNKMINVVV